MKTMVTVVKRNYAPHRCDSCGCPYYRSNRVRLWVAVNFGSRKGWQKVEQKICCKCLKAAEARTMLKDIDPRFVPKQLV